MFGFRTTPNLHGPVIVRAPLPDDGPLCRGTAPRSTVANNMGTDATHEKPVKKSTCPYTCSASHLTAPPRIVWWRRTKEAHRLQQVYAVRDGSPEGDGAYHHPSGEVRALGVHICVACLADFSAAGSSWRRRIGRRQGRTQKQPLHEMYSSTVSHPFSFCGHVWYSHVSA